MKWVLEMGKQTPEVASCCRKLSVNLKKKTTQLKKKQSKRASVFGTHNMDLSISNNNQNSCSEPCLHPDSCSPYS